MKILMIIFLTLLSLVGFSQRHGVYVGLGTEMTVAGPFGAFYTGVELNRHVFGFMYGTKIDYNSNEYSPPQYFTGMSYQFTFYREGNLQLGGMLRAGFVDSEFLVYIPSLIVDFVFGDYFKLALSAGARGQNPAVGLNMFFNIPFKKNEFPNPVKISFKKKK